MLKLLAVYLRKYPIPYLNFCSSITTIHKLICRGSYYRFEKNCVGLNAALINMRSKIHDSHLKTINLCIVQLRLCFIFLHFGFFTLYLLISLAEILILGIARSRIIDVSLNVILYITIFFSGRGPFYLTVSFGCLYRYCYFVNIIFRGFLTYMLFRCNIAVNLGRLILLLLVG